MLVLVGKYSESVKRNFLSLVFYMVRTRRTANQEDADNSAAEHTEYSANEEREHAGLETTANTNMALPTGTPPSLPRRPSISLPQFNPTVSYPNLPFFPSPFGFQNPFPQFPQLQTVGSLEPHLKRVNSLLSEYRLTVNGAIVEGRYHTVMNLVLESLKDVKGIYYQAEHLIDCDYTLNEFCSALLSEFCDRVTLSKLVQEEINALKLTRPYIQYVSGLRRVYRMHTRIFSRECNISRLFDHILITVPREVYKRLGRQLQAVDSVQWTTALPFDSDDSGQRTVLSILKEALAEQEIVEDMDVRIKLLRKQAEVEKALTDSRRQPNPQDRAKRTTEQKSGDRKPWLEDWCKRFPKVYKCWGENWFEELRNLESKIVADAGEVKYLKNKGYGFIGVQKELREPLKCHSGEFIFKSKN